MDKIPTILVIATLDTKGEEAAYIKRRIEECGCRALMLDPGTMNARDYGADVSRYEVARAGGMELDDLLRTGDKGKCVAVMRRGAALLARRLYDEGRFDGVLGIGGGQGTDLAATAMRELPFGVPKFMVSTVASGKAAFGDFVGTKDIIMMHSVADIQGINFLTREVFDNAVAAVCGMVRKKPAAEAAVRDAVALPMLGTTTPGAMIANELLLKRGYDVVAFHQNGTGGIAMEDLIREGRFKGVLDLAMHEIGDRVAGGLHGSIRDYRLKTAGEMGIPQVVGPGSVNYAVWGPLDSLPEEFKRRKYVIHTTQLTLVRLSYPELVAAAEIAAERISAAKGPVHVYIPLRGFSLPDREGGPHWDPEGNDLFIRTLRERLDPRIPYEELDLHQNDREFVEIAVNRLVEMLKTGK